MIVARPRLQRGRLGTQAIVHSDLHGVREGGPADAPHTGHVTELQPAATRGGAHPVLRHLPANCDTGWRRGEVSQSVIIQFARLVYCGNSNEIVGKNGQKTSQTIISSLFLSFNPYYHLIPSPSVTRLPVCHSACLLGCIISSGNFESWSR